MNWFKHYLIASITIVVCLGESPAEGSTAKDISRVDSTYKSGLAYLESGKYENAERCFQAALEINWKHAPSYVGLGHVYLNRGNLKDAEKAFREALRKRKNYAPALNGLGLVFRNTEKMLDWAIKYFRRAVRADRGHVEAYYNLAQTYGEIGNTRELDTYKKLAKMDPDHHDVWFQIGRIYKDGRAGRFRNARKAEEAFRRQLQANRAHFGARTYLAQVLKEAGRTDEASAMFKAVVDTPNAYQRRAFLELAEMYQRARNHDLFDAILDAYLEGLPPGEQVLYYDLSLVVIRDELSRFQATPDEERKAQSENFWATRDPAPVTAANERWIEHCRRVAYAREHFSEYEFPWDVRGEVYVRYGRPDHISASKNIRFETDPKVLAVKDRLMNQAGEALSHLLLSRRMVSFYRELSLSVEKGMDDQNTLSTILGYPVYPVRGAWEYWIYSKVDGGVEVTFVQEHGPGPGAYKYAEMPHVGSSIWVDEITGRNPGTTLLTDESKIDILQPPIDTSIDTSMSTDEPKDEILHPSIDTSLKSILIWQRMNPGQVMHRVASKTPEIYEQDFATAPLDFFYDSASFKADERSVKLEVYYGIPTRDLDYKEGPDGRLTAYVKRGLALHDEDNKPVYRSSEDMELYASGPIDTTQIAFVPEMDRLSVAPGTYRLSVQILDSSSDKSQVYNREVELHPYGDDSLQVSDIEMASLIRPSRGSKFTKGEIEVVPNPSLFYFAGQPVFIYYEVYNLKKDEFGRTDYRVSYELHSLNKGNVAVRILKALGRLVGIDRKAEVVTVEYAHEGDRADEYGYLELDMSKTDPGRQLLIVKVSDEIAGSQASSAISFAIR